MLNFTNDTDQIADLSNGCFVSYHPRHVPWQSRFDELREFQEKHGKSPGANDIKF